MTRDEHAAQFMEQHPTATKLQTRFYVEAMEHDGIIVIDPDPPAKSRWQLMTEKIITTDHGLGAHRIQIWPLKGSFQDYFIQEYLDANGPGAESDCNHKANRIREDISLWLEKVASDSHADGKAEGIKQERERIIQHIKSLSDATDIAEATRVICIIRNRVLGGK